MAAAAGGLEVVGLGGADAAQPRTAAAHVDDDRRKLVRSEVRDSLLLQADARAGGGSHGSDAGQAGSVNHVDGGEFAFGLDERAPFLPTQILRHVLGELILRGNGVAEVALATSADGGLADDGVASHKDLTHGTPLWRPLGTPRRRWRSRCIRCPP